MKKASKPSDSINGTYLDAVLNSDYLPIKNDVEEKVKRWLLDNPHIREGYMVCIGKTMAFVSVQHYLGEK